MMAIAMVTMAVIMMTVPRTAKITNTTLTT
jgi:hypothetical protein